MQFQAQVWGNKPFFEICILDVNGNIMAYETRNIDGISIGYLIEAKEVKVPFGK